MPNKDIVCISESEIDGVEISDAIKNSIRDLQGGLCEVETHLLKMIQYDEIDAKSWLASHECNVELLNLVKELIEICKEIRPSGKALKIARDDINKEIDEFKNSGQNI